jgi:uncharacterized protein DUF2845
MRAFDRRTLQSAIKTIVLVMCFPLSAAAESLRCGEALIAEGTTQAEVAARCGQPSQIQRQTLYGESTTALPGGALPGNGPLSFQESSRDRAVKWPSRPGSTTSVQIGSCRASASRMVWSSRLSRWGTDSEMYATHRGYGGCKERQQDFVWALTPALRSAPRRG